MSWCAVNWHLKNKIISKIVTESLQYPGTFSTSLENLLGEHDKILPINATGGVLCKVSLVLLQAPNRSLAHIAEVS